jgi:hypothetical protein
MRRLRMSVTQATKAMVSVTAVMMVMVMAPGLPQVLHSGISRRYTLHRDAADEIEPSGAGERDEGDEKGVFHEVLSVLVVQPTIDTEAH